MLISHSTGKFVPLQSLYGPVKPIHLGMGRTLVHSEGGCVFRRHNRMSCLQPWTRSGLWAKESVPRSEKKVRKGRGRLWWKLWWHLNFLHFQHSMFFVLCGSAINNKLHTDSGWNWRRTHKRVGNTFQEETFGAGLQEVVRGGQGIRHCNQLLAVSLLWWRDKRFRSKVS